MAAEKFGPDPQETETRDLTARFLAEFASDNPAEVILRLEKNGLLSQILPEVVALKGVEQRPDYHLEGDVWEHTVRVLQCLPPNASLDLRLAALFHDIGKAEATIRGLDDVLHSHDHQDISAEMTERILNRLHRFCPSIGIDGEKIIWLVKYHLVGQGSGGAVIREATVRRFFLRSDGWGEDLLLLLIADTIGREAVGNKSKTATLDATIARIEETKARDVREKTPPPPILDGRETMALFNLSPSPAIGQIKAALLKIYERLGFTTQERGMATAISLRDLLSLSPQTQKIDKEALDQATERVLEEFSGKEPEDFGQEIISVFSDHSVGEDVITLKEIPEGQWHEVTVDRNKARQLESQQFRVLILGSPRTGKTSFVHSLTVYMKQLLEDLPFQVVVGEVDLDKSRLDLSHLKELASQTRKRRWTRPLAQKAQREFVSSEANIVLGDSPGGEPDEITEIITQSASCAILLVRGVNDTIYQERRKQYREFLESCGVLLIGEFRTRPVGQFKDSTSEPLRSELRTFVPEKFIGGQIIGLQFKSENQDPVIEDTAKALLFSILPGLITKK